MPFRSLSEDTAETIFQTAKEGASAVPKLLVSVRNVEEAVIALEAEVDLLDVKEPDAGPLGAASPEILSQIGVLKKEYPTIPFSAALGELIDCEAAPLEFLHQANQFSFVKIGLAGLGGDSNWPAKQLSLRNAHIQNTGTKELQWVSVAYADFQSCNAPSPSKVLEEAVVNGSVGFLVDTYSKTGKSTFDFMSLEQLIELRQVCRKQNLFFALAGSIKAEHLAEITEIQPDIIAIRGAVCGNSNRNSAIEEARIKTLKTKINSAFAAVQSAD